MLVNNTPQKSTRRLIVSIAVLLSVHVFACSGDDPVVPLPKPVDDPVEDTPAWEWQNPLPQGNHLSDVSFFDARTGVAVGGYGTILRTTDGGITWETRSSGTTAGLSAVSVAGGTNGIAVGGAGTILQTTDGGITWERRESGVTVALTDVAFADGAIATVVGWSGTVRRTTDSGHSWAAQQSGTAKLLTSVAFTDEGVGTIVGFDGMLRTTNGGATWLQQALDVLDPPYAEPFYYDVSYAGPNKGFARGSWLGGGLLLVTSDAGVSWKIQTGWDLVFLQAISQGDANTIIVTGSSGDVLRTTSGGLSWKWEKPFPESYSLHGAAFTSPITGTAVGAGGMIVRTDDGGDTWSRLTRGEVADLSAVSFTDADHGFAVGKHDAVLRTVDGGKNWVNKNIVTGPGPDGLSDVFAVDINTATVVGYWGIWKTEDAGNTWANKASDHVSSVSFVGDVGVAVGYQGVIVQTLDGGETWGSRPSGTNNALLDVSLASSTTGVAVGEAGIILRTTDGGTTWVSQPRGTDQLLRGVAFVNENTGTAVGYSGTILRTEDAGKTWLSQSSGTEHQLRDVSFFDAQNGIVIGDGGTILRTHDGGATWKIDASGTGNQLNGVSFTDANSATVVGSGGTILRAIPGEH